MNTLVHSPFSVKVWISEENLRSIVARIFESEAIAFEAIEPGQSFSVPENYVFYLDSPKFELPPHIGEHSSVSRNLFLIVPHELETKAAIWWENGLVTDFVTTRSLSRLPATIRKHASVFRSREFLNPALHFEGLGRVVKSILEAKGLDDVVKVAAEESGIFLGAQRTLIFRHYPNQGHWRNVAEFRVDSGLEETVGFQIQDTDHPTAKGTDAQGENRGFVNVKQLFELEKKIAARFPGSWLISPIHVGEETWGTFNLLRPPEAPPWSDKDIAVATTFADTLGFAIKQCHLFNQLQQDIEERIHLYHALHESENRFRAVVGSSPLPITIKDLDGRYTYVNPAGERLYGAPEVNLIGRQISDFLPPHQAKRSRETDQLVVREGESHVFEERRDLVTGTYDLQMIKFPLFDDASKTPSVCTIFEDVTAKKKLLSDLQQSENRYRLIASAIPDTLIRLSAEGICLDFFSPGNDFLPGQAGTIQGRPFSELGLPEDLSGQILETCRVGTESGKVSSFEYRIDVAGQPRWFEIRVTSSFNGDSILIIRDVSERREFIEELKARENQLRLLETAIDNARDIVVITDTKLGNNPGQHILYANRTFERFTGYTQEEVIGKTPRILHGPGTESTTREKLRQAIHNWESVTVEVLNYKKDGTEFWSELSLVPLLQPDGIYSHWVSVQRDITERKRSEAILRQSQKMEAVGQLTSGVAHNFNNILMIISGHSQLLEKSLGHDTREKKQVTIIHTAVQRGAELVRQLMAYSRAGQLDTGIYNIVEKVRETISLIEKVLPTSLDIRVDLPDKAVWVNLDGEKFTQCLLNLAVNARDAMPEGGLLRFVGGVHLKDDPEVTRRSIPPSWARRDVFRLEVIDTGIGMTPEIKERIFEPFFTTKEMGNGTGLGLASVFGFMTEAKGEIQVESIPSLGSSFRLFFPLAEPPAFKINPARKAASGNHDHQGLKVLLVEDEQSTRILIQEMLESVGFVVYSAENGIAGLEIVQKVDFPFDLLITDWVMPKMGGRSFIELFERNHPTTPVIVITGTPDPKIIRPNGKNEIFLVPKPFSLGDLVQTISMALDLDGETRDLPGPGAS